MRTEGISAISPARRGKPPKASPNILTAQLFPPPATSAKVSFLQAKTFVKREKLIVK
jgi:hypothetical protein